MSFSRKILFGAVAAVALPIIASAQSGQTQLAAIAQTTAKETAKAYELKGTPTQAIQELDGMLDDFHIGSKLTAQQEEENRQLKRKIIHGTFDIHELSRLALSKHWDEIAPDEQERFVKLLTDLIEEKALFSKEQLAAKSKSAKKYRVVYRGDKFLDKDKKTALTRTRVIVPSENIDIGLNYKLKRQDGVWKVFDVIVDEASLVDNYRYQFDSIIKKSGYPELVRRMSTKLDEIRKKRTDNS
jgi:phospholipid transport system substrate-binding protein